MADNRYSDALADKLDAHPDVADWRTSVRETQTMSIGRDVSGLAGPYNPPTRSQGLGCDAYVLWKDGTVSEAAIEPHHFEDLDTQLARWKENSREDPDAAKILEPRDQYPDVKTSDDKVLELLASDDPTYPFETMEIYATLNDKAGTENIEGKTRVRSELVTLQSSTDLDVSYTGTSCYTGCEVGGQVGEGDSSVNLISLADCGTFVDRAAMLYRANQNRVTVPDKEIDVIFGPEAMQQLTSKFIEENFDGATVAQKQSAFTTEDFLNNKHAFGSVNLVLDSRTDYKTRSAPCDEEGVPGQIVPLVVDGRLCSPILNVKWGDKLNLPYTGDGALYYRAKADLSLDKMIASIQDGLLIEYFLGIHTQMAVTGNYSMPTYLALRIEDGKLVGGTKVTVAGNFFEDLENPQAEFAYRTRNPNELAMKLTKKVIQMKD